MREYKHGSKWAFWRWKLIPNARDLYLARLHLIHTLIGGVMLHWIYRPDPAQDLHDHPASFLSIVLRGEYLEQYQSPMSAKVKFRKVTLFNFKRASYYERHRIVSVKKKTLTLVFYGPNRREWGFHTVTGWINYRQYKETP